MRRSVVLTVAVVLTLAGATALAARVAQAAEVTRTLKAEIPSGSAWAAENLAGTMKVVPGTGSTVVVVATVHAESDALAGAVRLEQVSGEKGVPTLRVRYPVDSHTTYRYPGKGHGTESVLSSWLGGGTHIDYDGVRVKITGSSGVLIYADVEVQVPAHSADGGLINHVGLLEAHGVEGSFRFLTASGDIALEKTGGTIKATTGSGDVKIAEGSGSIACTTGSGDVVVEHFSGEALSCDVGSGDVTVHAGAIRKVSLETGSGDIKVKAVDAEEFSSNTGSGDVLFEATGSRLVKVDAETGSGDVTLRLGSDASFDVRADQGSGDLVNRYDDATPIAKGREVIGYKRGDGRTRVRIDTGSGDVVIEPGSTSA
jgi:hypothetical protein